jgi:hypothetical protein
VARTYAADVVASREADEPPAEFARALAALRDATPRAEVVLEETPAPQRLAPHAVALAAEVLVGGNELATGRLVLLHDPAGHESWDGTFRVVTFVRASLEPEKVSDPMLPGVGWAWLQEALALHGAQAVATSGTVTRVASESFGTMSERPATAEIEIRASWTPVDEAWSAHLLAWCDLMCVSAGLPPVPEGVVALPARQRRR